MLAGMSFVILHLKFCEIDFYETFQFSYAFEKYLFSNTVMTIIRTALTTIIISVL